MYKARRLSREYRTCIGGILSVGRRRIRGTRIIVHIASYKIGKILLSPILSFKW